MQNKRGFTLVELLATITILFLIGTTFYQQFILSQRETVNNQEKLEALNVAQGVLERAKAGDYPELTPPPSELPVSFNYRIDDYYIIIIIDKEVDLELHTVEVYVNDEADVGPELGKHLSSVRGLVDYE